MSMDSPHPLDAPSCLVTGGSGFPGINLTPRLSERRSRRLTKIKAPRRPCPIVQRSRRRPGATT
jgi:nucleoside-diphosphate-sugar epimerase